MKISNYLNESPIVALNLVYESVVTDVNRRLKSEGVNLLQGLCLTALLFEESESVTPSSLAKIFGTSRANVSHMISHLEARGWVKRAVNKEDARQFLLRLTPEGKKVALRLIKFYDGIQDKIEERMGKTQTKKLTMSLLELKKAHL